MKVKLIIATVAFLLLGGLTLSQVSRVNAISISGQISPITGPITSAAHILKGRIGIRVINLIYPATGVTVKATNFLTGSKNTTTHTAIVDSQGSYSFVLNEGNYIVSVNDSPHVDFPINEKPVSLYQDSINTIEFLGIYR